MPTRLRARTLAAELGASSAASPEDLIASGVDALVIATPTPSHAPFLRLAAAAGLPAFCEKPVGLDVETVTDVAATVADAGTLVQVGFQRRFDAGYRAAATAISSGALGELLVVRLATHDPVPPAEAYIASSGGIFRDLHIHDFDAVRFVTGQEVVDVYADGAVKESAWFADHGDVDVAVAVLRLSGGGLAILSGARHDPLGYDVRLEAFGTRDSIAVGLDARSPIRSVEPGVPPPRSELPRLHGSLRAGLPRRARRIRRYRPHERDVRLLADRGPRRDADRRRGRSIARRATSHTDRRHLGHSRLRPHRNPTKETGTQWASKKVRTKVTSSRDED